MIKALENIFLRSVGPQAKPTRGMGARKPSLESVVLQDVARHRDPKQAVTFLERLDKQLGLTAAMKSEKHELMAEDSHAFFRALPSLFYHDLQTTYVERSRLLPEPAPRVAIVGDAHIQNAGTFRGPDGKAVWGLNDFDQAEVGSPEWDLERMGVSLYVAARGEGLSKKESLDLVRELGKSYLQGLDEDGPAYLTQSQTSGKVKDLIQDAGSRSQDKFLAKWTTEDGGKLVRDETLEEPDKARGRQVLKALETSFPDLEILDLASKPHSGGSTRGLERYYALVQGKSEEAWLLEVKAVLPSPVQIPDGDLSRGDGDHVLAFQQGMGSPTDHRHKAFKLDEVAFFTREREREKDSLKGKAKNLDSLTRPLGRVLARAHNASGADIKGWVDGRDSQLLDNLESFVELYARQVESDFREVKARYG